MTISSYMVYKHCLLKKYKRNYLQKFTITDLLHLPWRNSVFRKLLSDLRSFESYCDYRILLCFCGIFISSLFGFIYNMLWHSVATSIFMVMILCCLGAQ